MNFKPHLYYLMLIIFGSIGVTAHGQLATYNFTGSNNCPTTNDLVDAQPANATFSAFTRVNVDCNSTAGVYSSDNWCTNCVTPDFTEYVGFTVTADPGFIVTAATIGFGHKSTSNLANQFRVAVSKDNFATTHAFIDYATSAGNSNSETWDFPDISSDDGGTLSFRWYVYGTSRTSGNPNNPPEAAGAFAVDATGMTGSVTSLCCPVLSNLGAVNPDCRVQDPAPFTVDVSDDCQGDISFVYFNTEQSGTDMYTGGTSLGTASVSGGTATLASSSFPTIAGTYYIYAILATPPAAPLENCRPFGSLVLNRTEPACTTYPWDGN
ncbi:MAG: hypothetical protein AB8F95_16625 [Bacteroidia bacterium]